MGEIQKYIGGPQMESHLAEQRRLSNQHEAQAQEIPDWLARAQRPFQQTTEAQVTDNQLIRQMEDGVRQLAETMRERPEEAPTGHAEIIGDHSIAIIRRATAAVIDQLRDLRLQIDELESELTADSARVVAGIRGHMALGDEVGKAADVIKGRLGDMRAKRATVVTDVVSG